MLLTEEQKIALVNQIIDKARVLLAEKGVEKKDQDTGLVHTEYRAGPFVMIQHQRQQLEGGKIDTNGLDIWLIEGVSAKKALSVNYVPFLIKHFHTSAKADWIRAFLEIHG